MRKGDNSKPLVVVFGGAGYIGSVLSRMLLQEDYRVRVVDNFLFGAQGVQGIESEDFQVVEADICDTRAVSSAMRGAEAVVLLAAIIGHRVLDGDWNYTRSVNFLASTVVLDAAIEHGVSRFLFASTNSVYGLQGGVMYETGIPAPVSLYSRLKLRLEERILNSRGRRFHPVALRLATCHGHSPRMRFDLVLNGLIRDAFHQKELIIETPQQMRALIHVDDAARSFISCLKAHQNMISGEIFNVGCPEQSLQIGQLASKVAEKFPGLKVTLGDLEPDLTSYHLSCSKMEKLIGFRACVSIDESIDQLKQLFEQGAFEQPYSLRYLNT
jgi:nucleoside-diphosphate-sugar epimerase